MARGGARTGAGRKRGSKNKTTIERETLQAEIVAEAKTSGISPLEVMLGAMRHAWDADDKEAAARFAKDAAPYVHPRLAAVEHTGKDGKDLMPEVSSSDVARAVLDILREARVGASDRR